MRSFFKVVSRQGHWYFQTPEGKPFFSAGVCCIDEGASRKDYRANAPEYAAFRHYKDSDAWAEASARRLRSWNFNTVGGWSSEKVRHRGLPYTVVLHLATYLEGGIWGDLFSPNAEKAYEDAARTLVRPLAEDPDLLGWFTDNELGWWDETHFVTTLQQTEGSATRRALIELLRTHYKNDFEQLRRDFDPGTTRRFEDLKQVTRIPADAGGKSAVVLNAFTEMLARRYYQLAQKAIRRYDRNHLILGDRYAQWYPASVARASAPFVDVVSTNMGANWTNGAICRFFLERLHQLTGRPILISEYYFAAMENRSGNKNTSGGFPTVRTQKERAQSVRRNLTELMSLPYVVGAHWFQFTDEPTNGRKDGENYNMGLVDIDDRPYELLTTTMKEVQREIPSMRTRHPADKGKVAVAPIPRAPASVGEGLRFWDTKRTFLTPATPLPCGDIYACWNPEYLYMAAIFADWAEVKLYPDGKMPVSEQTQLRLQWAAKSMTVRFPPGAKAESVSPDHTSWICHQEQAATTSTVVLRLPAGELGYSSLKPGLLLSLSATLTRHGNAEQVLWSPRLQLI